LKIAITGLSNSGKTTVFNSLTGMSLETTVYAATSGEPHIGVVKVPDNRIDRLSEIFNPKKTTYASVEYIDYLGITKGDIQQNRKVFDVMKDADALVHVVRAFENEAVPHPAEKVDPMRDVEIMELELVFGDLDLVEKRLERMDEAARKGKKQDEGEKKLLFKCREALEREIPLRDVEFNDEEQKAMRHLQFISTKPEIIVLNISEDDLNSERMNELETRVRQYFLGKQQESSPVAQHSLLSLCGKIEMEISRLPANDAKLFLDDLRIAEPALHKLITVSYNLLGLISFITVGEDEVRAWTIAKGTSAHRAAGRVHTDIERGFIRAEVFSYDDFIQWGSTPVLREKGLLRLEGKTYEVKDGDIINFRFNV
jgi:GTP-binding protein YchF